MSQIYMKIMYSVSQTIQGRLKREYLQLLCKYFYVGA